jgi:hypothetical protein
MGGELRMRHVRRDKLNTALREKDHPYWATLRFMHKVDLVNKRDLRPMK